MSNPTASSATKYHDAVKSPAPEEQLLSSASAPHNEHMQRNYNEDKLCRICLQPDDPEDMIAPCRCKGGSKWVHRDCLDEWRIHEHDRAFSACTECGFQYHFVPTNHRRRLRARFCWFVSRDLCLVATAVQLVIVGLAWIIGLVDRANGQVLLHVFGKEGCSTTVAEDGAMTEMGWCHHEELAVYYAYGLFSLLVLLGIFGCIFLCNNKCQIPDLSDTNSSIAAAESSAGDVETQSGATRYVPHGGADDPVTHRSVPNHRTQFYRHRRYRDDRGCCETCCMPRYGYYYPYYYYGPPGDCCCYCPDSGGCCSTSNSGDCCYCCHPAVSHRYNEYSRNSSNNDGAHILLIILLIVVVIMACIGLIVGIFLAIVIGQRVVQRHMLLLEKTRLVDDFPVQDLSRYDLTAEAGSIYSATPIPPPDTIYNAIPIPPPPTRSMNPNDELHLRKLGLMD